MLVYSPVHHCLSIAPVLFWHHSCRFHIPYTEGLVDKKDHRRSRTPPEPWTSWHTNPSVCLSSMIYGNSAHYCAHRPLPRISESSTNKDGVMVHFDPILVFWKLLKHLKHENRTAVFLLSQEPTHKHRITFSTFWRIPTMPSQVPHCLRHSSLETLLQGC